MLNFENIKAMVEGKTFPYGLETDKGEQGYITGSKDGDYFKLTIYQGRWNQILYYWDNGTVEEIYEPAR